MNNWEFTPYTPDMQQRWNEFVDASANGTFLLRRDFMEYHADRFTDASMLAFKKGKLAALLPANLTADGVLHSHSGLTYGGWVFPHRHVDGGDVLAMMQAWVEYCKSQQISAIDYKPIPLIYHHMPSQADLYALWRLGATVSSVGLSSTIDNGTWHGMQPSRAKRLRDACKLPITIAETTDIAAFWSLLDQCLQTRHDVTPVHTAAELELLHSRFPRNIRFFLCSLEGTPQAGVCMFDTPMVAHTQYMATTPLARQLDLLTPLVHKLFTEVFADRRYFDFGISTEDDGRFLNEGLLQQKTSFGAGTTLYQRLTLPLT